MCDNDSFDEMVAYRLRREILSRRGFGSLSLGAGLAWSELNENRPYRGDEALFQAYYQIQVKKHSISNQP